MADECVELTEALIKKILGQYPISALPDAIKAEIAKALPKGAKLCMQAKADGNQCNKGTREKPQMQQCCKFTTDPTAELVDIPEKSSSKREFRRLRWKW